MVNKMERPDVEGIEERMKELISGPSYLESQYLIGWIKVLERDMVRACMHLATLQDDYEELGNIAEEFIERRDRGEIRSTYTYNKFKEALGK